MPRQMHDGLRVESVQQRADASSVTDIGLTKYEARAKGNIGKSPGSGCRCGIVDAEHGMAACRHKMPAERRAQEACRSGHHNTHYNPRLATARQGAHTSVSLVP